MSIKTKLSKIHAHSPHHLIHEVQINSRLPREYQHLLIPIISQNEREDLHHLISIRKFKYWTKLLMNMGEETKRSSSSSIDMTPRARYLIIKFYHTALRHPEYPDWGFYAMLDMLCGFTAKMFEPQDKTSSAQLMSCISSTWPNKFEIDITDFKSSPKPILSLGLYTNENSLTLIGILGILSENGHYEELSLNSSIVLSATDLQNTIQDPNFKKDDIKAVIKVMKTIPHMAHDISFQRTFQRGRRDAQALLNLMKIWKAKLNS